MAVNKLSDTAADELLDKSPDQLYEILGMRAKAVEEDVGQQGTFEPEVAYSDHMGAMEDLQKLGRRIFAKVHLQAYGLICGSDSDDEDDRRKVIGALGIGWSAAVVTLSGVLVSSFGIGAAIAGVIAALVINRFAKPVAEEGYKGMCELWKEYLPESSE
jgi:hypothetical protein